MKNHIIVNGRLLQTNKKFSALKMKQKEFIYAALKEEYGKLMAEDGYLTVNNQQQLIGNVISKIEEREIWLPVSELVKFFNSKKARIRKALIRNN